MIKDVEFWDEVLRKYAREHELTFQEKLELLDVVYELARSVGTFADADPMEGLEDKIRVAKVLNSIRTLPKK